jgi:hypothetical protein
MTLLCINNFSGASCSLKRRSDVKALGASGSSEQNAKPAKSVY